MQGNIPCYDFTTRNIFDHRKICKRIFEWYVGDVCTEDFERKRFYRASSEVIQAEDKVAGISALVQPLAEGAASTILIAMVVVASLIGAKGLGELPMDGPAPAVVNALRQLGCDVREIPATPEHIASCAKMNGSHP